MAALVAAGSLFAATAAFAAPFTPGNVVVYRVGNGAAALSNAGTVVFLDEYTTAGTLVQSIALPTAVAGGNRECVAAGTSTSEGMLTRSTDNRFLVGTCYAAAPGTASIAGTTSAATNRVVFRVGSDGVVDTSTALTDFASAGNPRGAASTNGTDLWFTGSTGGVRYASFGSTTSTQLSTTVTNLRNAYIAGDQLHVSTSSGSAIRIGTVGAGTPTTAGQTIAPLPGLPISAGSPYAFVLLDLTDAVAGNDTLYVADDTANQILKYALVGGTWTANGTVTAAAVRGLAASVNAGTVTLFASSATALLSLSDASGYNATLTGTPTPIAAAGTNTAFRGIALAPVVGSVTPSLSINDVSVTEGNTGTRNAVFTVSLSSPAGVGGVGFTIATADQTATATVDYVPQNLAAQTIPAGQSTYTFTVQVNGDEVVEGNETFLVVVTKITGATSDPDASTGVGTIVDDDATSATLSIADATSVTEGDSGSQPQSFTVTLSGALASDVAFTASTAAGTATTADFVPLASAPFTIPGGSLTTTVPVSVLGDIDDESTESYTLTIASSDPRVTLGVATATGIINDNDDAPLSIPAIQGAGDASPQAGNTVITAGNIVTAVVSNGFVMQAPAPGDGNAGTSDGIFVFTGSAPQYTGTTTPVAVGDLVALRGRVVEFASTSQGRTLSGTQFTNTTPPLTINRIGTGSLDTLAPPLALDAVIPSPSSVVPACPALGSTFPTGTAVRVQNFECYEYMRVSAANAVVTAPNLSFGSDPVAEATVSLAGARTYREPGVAFPVAGEDASLAAITPAAPPLPAGFVWDANPELVEFDADRLGQPNTSFAPGTRLSATGVLGIDFADYEIWPSTYALLGPQPTLSVPVPAASADQLTIGSLNVRRLYDLCDDPSRPAPPNGGEPSLTPTQIANTNAKLEKLSAYIRNIMRAPDVIGLQEVEHPSAPDTVCAGASLGVTPALQLLANRIALDGGPTYTVAYGQVRNDPGFIAVGFLYRADRIASPTFTQLRATEQFSFAYTDGNGASQVSTGNLNDRPALLLEASSTAGTSPLRFAVIVNHLRSLGGIDDLRDTQDTGDPITAPTFRQDAHRVRQKRLRQAISLACEVQAFQSNAANSGVPLVVIGDFNAFQFSDGYADVAGIIRGDTNPAQSEYDIGFGGTPTSPCVASGGQIVQPALEQALLAVPDAQRYSFNFEGNAQVLDHAFLNGAASGRFEGFAFGRGNADAQASLEFDVAPANLLLRASDHDGFVLRINPGTRPTQSGWLLFQDGFEP
ncbi:MAG: endonuclease/exonuclease/phosphatase family protein [Xanthomonadaceae bacterium]|jgi:predicted extracellular nuclease|nr:endonuclease/exonuclease/phosphatase family protein [Xanthomonadaceae bacterium]